MIPLKYNTASQEVPLGFFVDSSDGDTEETGLTIANTDIKLWKSGATSLANKNSGGATHISNGIYYATLDATDTNSYGPLVIFVHVSGALPVRLECLVMEADAYDALYAAAGSGHIAADAVQISGDSSAADNLEADYDGTGYNKSNSSIGTVTAVTNDVGLTGTAVADIWDETLAGHSSAGTSGKKLSDAAQTDELPSEPPTTAQIKAQVDSALADIHLDHLLAAADSDTPVDNSIIAKLAASDGDWSGFDETAGSLEALRDRGDAAWTTGGGGSITDMLHITPIIPLQIDLADSASWRIGLKLYNALDDLPSTAEIAPGTISIDRKAKGGTNWTAVVSDAACSEAAGLIYYDEVFDGGSGYGDGDSLRMTFKSQKIVVSGNDYEINDSSGTFYYCTIKQTTTAVKGAIEYTYTVDDGSSPLDGAEVWIATDAGSSNVIWYGVTDASGVARASDNEKPWLDAGSYYAFVKKAGYSFGNPDTLSVS